MHAHTAEVRRKRPRHRPACKATVVLCLATTASTVSAFGCDQHNNCNGHGVCSQQDAVCLCYEGWGADSDISLYKAQDCSARVCPSGPAWGDVPTAKYTAHAALECSGMGLCDRDSGVCRCFTGFEGDACQRMACPNNCSGHGRCMSLKNMVNEPNALPLSSNAHEYGGDELATTWDEDRIFGCVCDSSWAVGLKATETQAVEWFGPDCSLRHCPSGNDPAQLQLTPAHPAEKPILTINCEGVATPGVVEKDSEGAEGNLCHVDCSGRGVCDYATGVCQCFNGYYGQNCGTVDVLAVYDGQAD
ncbi:hypothetical protein JKP88DRAFT_334362 [Tribonema minus]|uniref:EGF-like domain-containing protein n=1 Tax=Tribonema minus TaxID=303371 RepID=A0A835YN50_9STRA|nr:hypothetical protein JKP88DRAFT_334362 [Tribonema minus]